MTKSIEKKLLIFSAHPDDDLSCAGTALYLKSLGFKSSEAVFTGGERSINLSGNKKSPLKNIRTKELTKAAKMLGVENLYMLGQPDSNVIRTPQLLDEVVRIIRKEKPTVVITENPKDYHYDHQQVGKIVTEAVERAGWGVSSELGERFKTPVGLYMGTLIQNERSDVLVDITRFWDKKTDIMRVYEFQLGPRAFDFNEALGKYFGYYLRVPYAESFEVMKNYPIRLNLLAEILSQ